MLEKEIRELLFLLQPPSLQVESLANMYMDRYGKPLRNEGLLIDGQQQEKAGCSLTDVLMRLNTTRVIERFLVIFFILASFALDNVCFSGCILIMTLSVSTSDRDISILSQWKMLLCTWHMVSNWGCLLLAAILIRFLLFSCLEANSLKKMFTATSGTAV
jgi:hypothetical protein